MIADTISRAGNRLGQTGNSIFGVGQEREEERTTSTNKKRKSKGLAGGGKAIAAFVISLFAFTIQTEAAQYVQQSLGFRKPFFSLYIGHSAFTFLFPLYMVCLRIFQPDVPISHQLHLISLNLHWQLSTPTHSLPKPTADSIRKRLSSLSMRTEVSVDSEVDGGDQERMTGEDYDFEEISQRTPRTKPPPARKTWSEKRFGFNVVKLLGVFAVLTLGITIPALSWYSAVPLTTMADITTIYNTYAVWALVFSIIFLGEQWERRKVFSVLLACGGVVLVAYGGAEHRRRPREPEQGFVPETPILSAIESVGKRAFIQVSQWISRDVQDGGETPPPSNSSNPFLGDMLAFIGAVTMAAYEMAFKVVGTLPDEEAQRDRFSAGGEERRSYSRLDASTSFQDDDQEESETLLNDASYDQSSGSTADVFVQNKQNGDIGEELDETKISTERTAMLRSIEVENNHSPLYQSMTPPVQQGEDENSQYKATPSIAIASHEAARQRQSSEEVVALEDWIPPPMPFGLHPIIITSGIGFVTMLTLWIGLPIANALGWEPFSLPGNWRTYLYLFVVAFTGIIFNGCFSILLALWGPVLASVSCLLTTVLVFIADILLGHDFKWISLLGCISIVAGFGVLVSGGHIH